MVDIEAWQKINTSFAPKGVTLVAVSKTKPIEDVMALYEAGQRDFGENYVQELVEKQAALPKDIRWHFIGHLQSNKVKYIAPFVHLIHGVDNQRLLDEINKQGSKHDRKIDVLLQVFISTEETKFGMDAAEVHSLIATIRQSPQQYNNINICGLMGMASNTENTEQVRSEFKSLASLLASIQQTEMFGIPTFKWCSMGMSGDYEMAIEEGSNMARIGSLLFGKRNYPTP